MRKFLKVVFSLNFLYMLLIAAQVAAIVFLCLYIPSVMPLAFALSAIWLFSSATAVIVMNRGGSSEVRCSFLLLIIALPVAGALICLIAGAKSRPRGLIKMRGETANPLSKAANELIGTCGCGYDKAVYFDSGEKYFDSLFSELERAQKRIYLEFFIISRGKIFEKLLGILQRAGKRGVEIKIMCDGMGSAFRAGRKEYGALKKAGAEIKIFHRITPVARARLNLRDHRKIAAIDGKVAFTGGINLADEYANIDSPYGQWKDTGIAVYGGAAKAFEGMFLAVWQGEYSMEAPSEGVGTCLPYYDSPPYGKFCENAYTHAISSAVKRVHVMTPYFCADGDLERALSFAARRGADVKVILPNIPDKKFTFELSLSNAEALKESGIKFYRYTPGFLHAKCLICDDKVFLGSYNFDFRSSVANLECGVMFGGEVAQDVERDFNDTLALSSLLVSKKVPAAKKLYRLFLKLFAPLF